jgi:hypothetical protein
LYFEGSIYEGNANLIDEGLEGSSEEDPFYALVMLTLHIIHGSIKTNSSSRNGFAHCYMSSK